MYFKSFEMNQQQTYSGSSFYVGWMRYTLVYKNPLFQVIQLYQAFMSYKMDLMTMPLRNMADCGHF